MFNKINAKVHALSKSSQTLGKHAYNSVMKPRTTIRAGIFALGISFVGVGSGCQNTPALVAPEVAVEAQQVLNKPIVITQRGAQEIAVPKVDIRKTGPSFTLDDELDAFHPELPQAYTNQEESPNMEFEVNGGDGVTELFQEEIPVVDQELENNNDSIGVVRDGEESIVRGVSDEEKNIEELAQSEYGKYFSEYVRTYYPHRYEELLPELLRGVWYRVGDELKPNLNTELMTEGAKVYVQWESFSPNTDRQFYLDEIQASFDAFATYTNLPKMQFVESKEEANVVMNFDQESQKGFWANAVNHHDLSSCAQQVDYCETVPGTNHINMEMYHTNSKFYQVREQLALENIEKVKGHGVEAEQLKMYMRKLVKDHILKDSYKVVSLHEFGHLFEEGHQEKFDINENGDKVPRSRKYIMGEGLYFEYFPYVYEDGSIDDGLPPNPESRFEYFATEPLFISINAKINFMRIQQGLEPLAPPMENR